jgi:hypothetical protein
LKVANDFAGSIGETPMVRIDRLAGPNDAAIYAKHESCNIGAWVKGRLDLCVFEHAEGSGRLAKGKMILEAISETLEWRTLWSQQRRATESRSLCLIRQAPRGGRLCAYESTPSPNELRSSCRRTGY